MEIRKYSVSDREMLINLWKDVFPDDPPQNEPGAVIAAKLKVDDLIYLALKHGQVIGACMAGYDGHRGWLYGVAVAPDYRRQGIGEELIRETEKGLAEMGCIKINLQIRSTNSAVQVFYESIGYETEDRISMGKSLGAKV